MKNQESRTNLKAVSKRASEQVEKKGKEGRNFKKKRKGEEER